MLFIGDERLQKTRKIPIFNFPAVIMNKYYGFEWGLTDFDGISQLASNAPLEYRLTNGDVKQAYEKARFDGVSIPYYYLDYGNKANFSAIARTYTGNNNYYDFGDVVATAQPGTHLINGKISKGKMCFFGIAKTKFWTDDARELFEDCVKSVLIICKKNSDCDDGNQRTEDICINPGTVHSECKNENIKCFEDSECGTNSFFVNSFCDGLGGNDVFRNFLNFTCVNKGKSSSFCKNESSAILTQQCKFGCFAGACINDNIAPVTELISPIDGFETLNPNINFIYNVSDDSEIANCSLSIDGNIVVTSSSILRGVNSFSRVLLSGEYEWKVFCFDVLGNKGTSEARKIEIHVINCTIDSDCGMNGFGNNFCMNDNLFRDNIEFKCMNPGTTQSFCTNITTSQKVEDCGEDVFVGDKFCAGNDVFRNFKDFKCINGNNAKCSSTIIQKIVEECPRSCNNGECIVECNNDEDCGTDGFVGNNFCMNDDVFGKFKEFECVNPGTKSSFCDSKIENKLIIKNCPNGCNDGKCIIICTKDEDCGTDGFTGNLFCIGDDVFRFFKSFTCQKAGTSLSFCTDFSKEKIIQSCMFTCNGGVCAECITDQTRTCGTSSIGECKLGIQTCSNSGTWGSCVGNIEPKDEVCDGKDNDCDSVTDEGCIPQCSDGKDNDRDGRIDYPADSGCSNRADNSE